MKLNDELDLKDETRLRTTGAVEFAKWISPVLSRQVINKSNPGKLFNKVNTL